VLTEITETRSPASPLYDPETFKVQGYHVIDMLADYMSKAQNKERKVVLPNTKPEQMLKEWSGDFSEEGSLKLEDILSKTLDLSNNLHHPCYIGHQVSGPLPTAVLCDLVSIFLNNTSAAFEMGPVSTIMERKVISWMASHLGFGDKAEGVFTSGGTVGNLTALLAARQNKAGHDIWNDGIRPDEKLAFLVSEQAHYSSKRAIQIMGFGDESVFHVPSDSQCAMDLNALEETYAKAIKQGYKVVAIVANACSTATGTYDPLEEIADFCEKYDLWLHIDGAHGASAVLSDKYKSLLKGVERADSVVWDAHKMMLMPALITAVIFRNGGNSYEVFSQKASYIFEKSAREEWYNLCHRTMECTKTMMILKLYTSLKVHGTKVFSDYVTYTYDLTRQFAEILKETGLFEIPTEPMANIICFRYKDATTQDMDQLQKTLRARILNDQSFYITQTEVNGKTYMRCTIINPHTSIVELRELIEKIKEVASK
jgi:L-2,4-diaminobutyrate decarboxylase